MERYPVGKALVTKTNLINVLINIKKHHKNNVYGYICLMDARAAYIANNDKRYRYIQNNSLLTLPDGMPLVWMAHNYGYSEVCRISGKDFMDAIFSVSEKEGYTHYYYGGSEETIKNIQINLRKKYNGLVIIGAESPPFQPIEKFDIEKLAEEINKKRPTFFWCGLGAPKQELLISMLQKRVQETYCVGVGLAFEYFAGTVRRAPKWMQKSGLEWIIRLSQQPRNVRRIIRPFMWIIKELMLSNVKIRLKQKKMQNL